MKLRITVRRSLRYLFLFGLALFVLEFTILTCSDFTSIPVSQDAILTTFPSPGVENELSYTYFEDIDHSDVRELLPNPSNLTMVTAYFDFGRSDRDADFYLSYLSLTLRLPVPFVVYTQKNLIEKVKAITRPEGIQTVYIEMELEDLPYHRYIDKVNQILKDPVYKARIVGPDRPECTYSMYTLVQFSKFPLVIRASKEKKWSGDKYVWIDAASTRFFHDFDVTKPWNGSRLTDRLAVKYFKDRKYTIRHVSSWAMSWDWLRSKVDLQEMGWESVSIIAGSVFGGTLKAFQRIEPEIEWIWEHDFLGRGIVNNEQMAMLILSLRKPELFDLVQHGDLYEPFYLNGQTYLTHWFFRGFLRYLRGDTPVSPYPLLPCPNYFTPCGA